VTFKDHFSEQATVYAKYRPNYPQELFAYVTSLATSREHSPVLAMKAHWSLAQLLGYLRTWSATQAFIVANGADPIESIISDLSAAWRNPNWQRLVSWPLTIRAGRLIP
jgi:hypothetical protein